jgi:hypothetical protein
MQSSRQNESWRTRQRTSQGKRARKLVWVFLFKSVLLLLNSQVRTPVELVKSILYSLQARVIASDLSNGERQRKGRAKNGSQLGMGISNGAFEPSTSLSHEVWKINPSDAVPIQNAKASFFSQVASCDNLISVASRTSNPVDFKLWRM